VPFPVVDPRLPRLLILTPRKPFPHLQLFNRKIFTYRVSKKETKILIRSDATVV
jgi:hypothetical protein